MWEREKYKTGGSSEGIILVTNFVKAVNWSKN
jgi:hypothetical protein